VGVTIGRLDLNHALSHFKNGDIEGAAAKVIDGDVSSFFLSSPLGQGSRGWLIHNTLHVQPAILPASLVPGAGRH